MGYIHFIENVIFTWSCWDDITFVVSCHGSDFLNIGPNVLTDRFNTWRIYVNILAYCTVSYATFYFQFIRS